MLLTYDEVKEICEVNEAFRIKHQKFGDTHVAQCTYFLAKAGDFFPEFIDLEDEVTGEKITIYGEREFNGKKIKNMSNKEIEELGFEFFKKNNFGGN